MATSRRHGNDRFAVISAVNRMTRIRYILVLAAICVVVADENREEEAKVHIELVEYELEDQCYSTAEAKWAFHTRSDLPDTVLENKVSDVRCRK
jgi:hypothetical protein